MDTILLNLLPLWRYSVILVVQYTSSILYDLFAYLFCLEEERQ